MEEDGRGIEHAQRAARADRVDMVVDVEFGHYRGSCAGQRSGGDGGDGPLDGAELLEEFRRASNPRAVAGAVDASDVDDFRGSWAAVSDDGQRVGTGSTARSCWWSFAGRRLFAR